MILQKFRIMKKIRKVFKKNFTFFFQNVLKKSFLPVVGTCGGSIVGSGAALDAPSYIVQN
jgi:hypothetical protein